MKIKVKRFCGYDLGFESYIVSFYRADGVTRAIVVDENGEITDYQISDLEVDFESIL